MKYRFLFLLSALIFTFAIINKSNAQSLLLEENFNFPGDVGGAKLTDNLWSVHNGTTNSIVTVAPGLEFQGYASSGIGLAAGLNNTGEDLNRTFTEANTVYAAFLMKTTTGHNAAGYFLHFGPATMSTVHYGRLWVNVTGTGIALGGGSGAPPQDADYKAITPGVTTLVVIKYDKTALKSYLYILNAVTTTEPTNADHFYTETAVTIGSIGVRQYNVAQRITVDGIRVATTWADLFPTSTATPTLNVSNTSLSGFTYQEGSATSPEQTFTVAGANLTNNIVITAPEHFEISKTSGADFTNTITLENYVEGKSFEIAETTIYVRLKLGLTEGAYTSEDITITSVGADSKAVMCAGTVTAAPQNVIFYFKAPTWLDNNPNAPQVWGPFASADWTSATMQVDPQNPEWWKTEVNVTYTKATTLTYQIRMFQDNVTKYQKATGDFNSNPTFTTETQEIWIDASDDASFTWQDNNFYLAADKITAAKPTTPPALIVSETALTGFGYELGATSSIEKSFTVSGTDLTADVTVTAPANYEVSKTSSTDYANSVLLTKTDNALAETTVYVRLKTGLTAGDYNNEEISITSTDAETKKVICSGTVTPIITTPYITVSKTSLSGFTYEEGSVTSPEQTFTVAGDNLTNNIVITAPEHFEISKTSGADFTNTITLENYVEGKSFEIAETTIYVRLKLGLTEGAYTSEDITITSVGADSKAVMCAGTVTAAPQNVIFYFKAPTWLDNNPNAPQVWGPFASADWTSATMQVDPQNPEWWKTEVNVTYTKATTLTYQIRMFQDNVTKYQKATGDFNSNPTFTTETQEIWIDASDDASFTWQDNNFYLAADKITQTKPEPVVLPVIFYETIGTVGGTTLLANHETADGFDNDQFTMTKGEIANPADIRATDASNYEGASGLANVFFTSTNTSGSYGFAIEGIDASNCSDMEVAFAYRKISASLLPTLTFDYWNGTAWINIPFTFNEAANAPIGWYMAPVIELPIEAQIADLKVRWVKSGGTAIRIDDIKLSGNQGEITVPQITNILFTPTNPTPADEVTVTADITDNGTIQSAVINWGTASGVLTNPITMTLLKGTYTGKIPQQVDGTNVFFTISATDNEANTTTSSEKTYIVKEPLVATKIVVKSVTPASPIVNTAFKLVVEAQAENGEPANVTENVTVTLSEISVNGTLTSVLNPDLQATITANTSEVTFSDLMYDYIETITITATSINLGNATTEVTFQELLPGGMEDFTNYTETATAYNTGTFVGNDGSTWAYTKCRGDKPIAGSSPCLGKDQTPVAEVKSGYIAGGCGVMNFEYMQPFSANVNLQVFVNDVQVATVTSSGEQNVVKNSGDIIVNQPGDFVIKFVQPAGAGQVSIDNINWTQYATTEPMITITYPANNQMFFVDNLNVTFTYLNDPETAIFKYSLDNNLNEIQTTSPIALSGLANGPHSLVVKMYDQGIELASKSIAFNINVLNLSTIAEARTQAVDAYVKVKGIVLNGAELGNNRYLQDPTAGIDVFSAIAANVKRGDEITVIGKIAIFNNLMQIIPNEITVNSSENQLPIPQIITIAQAGENYESEHVRIENVKFKETGNFEANKNYTLTDGTNDLILRTATSSNPAIGKPIPTEYVNINSILGQFNASDPNAGYQIVLRDMGDIEIIVVTTPTIKVDEPINNSTLTNNDVTIKFTVANFILGTDGQVKYTINSQASEYTNNTSIELLDLPNNTYVVELELVDMSNNSLETPVKTTVTFIVLVDDIKNLTNNCKVYPNPTNAILNIESDVQIIGISISDILGKEIYSTEEKAEYMKLDISNLQKGIYFINISTEKGKIVEKIIKL